MQQKRQRNGKKKIRKRAQNKNRKSANGLGVCLACILLVCGIAYYMMYREVHKMPSDRACNGIYIGQVDVSGMTAQEAQDAVDKKAVEYAKQKIELSVPELSDKKTVSVTLEELGFDIEKEEKLIEKAVQYGNSGNVVSRYFQLRKVKKEKKVFLPVYEVKEEKAAKVLGEKLEGLLPGASDATIRRENGVFVISDEVEGIELDAEATIKKIRAFVNDNWKGQSGTIETVSKMQKPAVTRADLEGIQDKLGTFSTYCGSGQTRVKNIINGAKLINGTVLMPGQEFSAGKKMQPFTRENGYVEAGAFENGKVIQSMAGGICQVSTTLYNAVINSELEVTSRYPHSMTVNYVVPSRDAAIAGDYKDLKFKNNLDTPIYIEGYVSGGNVIFTIYGKETRPEGRKIEFVSETLSTTEPKKTYVEDAGSAVGSIKEEKGIHKGMKARLWKVVYENGKEVSREVFNNSSYIPSKQNVSVGTASTKPEYSAIVRAAIKTQNEAKIKAAIAEVKAKEAADAQTPAEPEVPVTPPAAPPATPPEVPPMTPPSTETP